MSFLTKTRSLLANSVPNAMYAWLPVYSALALMLPAGTHYCQREYYTAIFLVIFASLRAGYHIDVVMKYVPMNAYHISYVISNALVHFNIIFTGLTYRRDLTTFFMLILAVYQSIILLWRLPEIFDPNGVFKDSGWNIYMVTVLGWNLMMHKLLPTDAVFVKGVFWGAYFWQFYMTSRLYPFGIISDIWSQLSEVASFVQFAPFTHKAAQKAFPAEDKEVLSVPEDDLD